MVYKEEEVGLWYVEKKKKKVCGREFIEVPGANIYLADTVNTVFVRR